MNINPQILQKTLIENLRQEKFISQEQFKRLERTIGKDRFDGLLRLNVDSNRGKHSEDILNKLSEEIDFVEKHHKSNLFQEQKFAIIINKVNSYTVKLHKLLSEKDSHPQVLKIKSELSKMGIEAQLDNNPEFAELCLEAMKFLESKHFPLPDEIISTKYTFDSQSINLNGKNIILLDSKDCHDMSWMLSTNSHMHTIIHEAVHCIQNNLLAFNLKKIPKCFEHTIKNLSSYASQSGCQEVHAELVTKKLICGLNKDEEQLLKYLEK